MKTKTHRTQPAPAYGAVDFIFNGRDQKVVLLGMLGFSFGHISAQTGYKGTQVAYRLKLAKVKLGDYREGRNHAAKSIKTAALFEFGNFLAGQLSRATGKRIVHREGKLLLQ